MSFLWDAVFIQVLDRTGPLMLNLSWTPYKTDTVDIIDTADTGNKGSTHPHFEEEDIKFGSSILRQASEKFSMCNDRSGSQ
jgi:hypothetical protein